jgi:hypothetical protein
LWDNIPNEAEFSNDPKSKSLVLAYSDVDGGAKEIDTGATGKLYWLEGNIDVDPNFVDPEQSDFRLIQGSPCIDAAVHNKTITFENGQIVVPAMTYLGSGPDIGACESHMVLPVELITFSAHVQKNDVILQWSTASESNNYCFEIFRRSEANTVQVGSLSGHGTSTTTRHYSFIDKNVPVGCFSYQLVQIDFDGTQHRSSSVQIEIKPPSTLHVRPAWPNPFNSNTTIYCELPEASQLSILIYNAVGQKVKTLIDQKMQSGEHRILWDGTDDLHKSVASGLYFMVLKTSDQTISQKIMVLR